jgi:hypothetical protein
MRIETLRARRHAPPAGWPVATFERVTDALAAALVAAHRRYQGAAAKTDAECRYVDRHSASSRLGAPAREVG